MPIEILMPALSPTMTEGNLAKWLKKEGDKVKPGDVLAEIETDKATMEVEAVDEGVIGKILIAAGTQNVPVNNLIALLLEEGESQDDIESYKPKAIISVKSLEKKEQITDISVKSEVISVTHSNDDRIKISPLAKRIAHNENIDLRRVTGSGPYGRIIKSDVLSATSNKKSDVLFRNPNEYKAIANSNVRRVIAKRLVESKQTIPHFYLNIECNIDKANLTNWAQSNMDCALKVPKQLFNRRTQITSYIA